MKTKTLIKLVLPAVAILAVPPLHAAGEPARGDVSGTITPKLYYFDYFKGFGSDTTQFLERYDYRKGSDTRTGAYLDADIDLIVANPRRDVFVLERQGFGAYNHRGMLKADADRLGFTASYSHFRSATGGVDFLYSPNQVTGGTDSAYFLPAGTNSNSGYAAQFNDDSGQKLFRIDRTTYAMGLALKPELFGRSASVTLNYDGYERDGNRFASYVLGGSDVTGGAARVLQRWRGFDMPVDEKMNRYSLNLTGTPGGGVQLVYDGVVEKFDNHARSYLVSDFAPLSTLLVSNAKPIHFVPDSTLISNQVRVAKNFGGTAIAAGYGLSVLDQDSFTLNQQSAGYNAGKITTNSAYVNVNSNVRQGVGLEGFVKYHNRDNDSTFPAVGLLNSAADQQLGVRIDKLRSLNYGLAATFRPAALKSTVTVGWKREDKDRDLTWTATSTTAPTLNGIQPQRSLYRQQTLSDELYLNWVMRPMRGLIVRVTPSVLRANDTGTVTEPAESLHLKAKVNYAASNGTSVSGYYNYKNRKNDNNTLTEVLATKLDGASLAQNTNNTLQSAGVTLGHAPNDKLRTTASLAWMRNDFATYFISSNRRRFEAPNNPVLFVPRDESNYEVDTYVLSVGADLQASAVLRYSGSYTFAHSKGNATSGYIAAALPVVDNQVNSDIQTLSLGVDYALRKTVTLKGAYTYEYFKDKVYGDLTGGLHALMLGVQLGF